MAGQAIELIGATIGNYRITEKIGEGGMGTVYLAEHPLIGKKVALKVLHAEHTSNPDVVARFFTEAKSVNDIGHPNIVDIVDYGQVQTGPNQSFVYFIMEYLQGEPLAGLIHRESPLAPERAMSLGMQIADALAASHVKGVIHRDLKPDNIYLVNRGRGDVIKLLDFGIAKLVSDPSGSRRTRTGIVMGTPAYMSPEQCEGKGKMDHRTDVYALGIVLFEMITGRVPFQGEGYGEILVQHLTQPCPAPSMVRQGLPAWVDAILMRALEKKPEHRFQTMEEMLVAMRDPEAYLVRVGGAPRVQGPATPVMGTPSPVAFRDTPTGLEAPTPSMFGEAVGGRSRKALYVGGVVLIAAIIGLAVALGGGGDPPVTGHDVVAADHAGLAGGAEAQATPDAPVAPIEPAGGVATAAGPDATPAVREVPIRVESSPPGAQIFLDGSDAPRGVTPTDLVMLEDGRAHELTYRLDGHKERTEKFVAVAGSRVRVKLSAVKVERKVERPRPTPRPKPKPTGGSIFKPIAD